MTINSEGYNFILEKIDDVSYRALNYNKLLSFVYENQLSNSNKRKWMCGNKNN